MLHCPHANVPEKLSVQVALARSALLDFYRGVTRDLCLKGVRTETCTVTLKLLLGAARRTCLQLSSSCVWPEAPGLQRAARRLLTMLCACPAKHSVVLGNWSTRGDHACWCNSRRACAPPSHGMGAEAAVTLQNVKPSVLKNLGTVSVRGAEPMRSVLNLYQ